MGDIKFIVNKESGTVVCTLFNCKSIPTLRIRKYMGHYVGVPCPNIQNTYTGVARCSAEDVWNEEYGKKLALARAKRKRAKDINKALSDFCTVLERKLTNIKQYGIHELPNIEDV